MKQVTYQFSLEDLAARLINPIPDVEDGYWQIVPLFETASPAVIPQMYPGQLEATLPGVIIRMSGITINKVEGPGPFTYKVEDKYLVKDSDGVNRDQSGSEQS